MAFSVPQVLPRRRTSAGSAPAAMPWAKPAIVESPEPVAFTHSMRGARTRQARPWWKAAEPAAPIETTTHSTPAKRSSEATASRTSSRRSGENSRPRRPPSSVRLGFTR